MERFGFSCIKWCARALLLVFVLPVAAQDTAGRIIGVVTDPSGSAVPRAKVKVTNVDTGASADTMTGPEGSYQVLLLPVGSYRVTAEAAGSAKR